MNALPITSAPPHDGLIPHAYVVRKLTQVCLFCNKTHEFTEVYSKTFMRNTAKPTKPPAEGRSAPGGNLASLRWGNKLVTNLRRLIPGRDRPEYALPLEGEPAAPHTIPFCHECFHRVDLSHLPPVPRPTPAGPELRATDLVKNPGPPRTRFWDKEGRERYEDNPALEGAKPPAKRSPPHKASAPTLDDITKYLGD